MALSRSQSVTTYTSSSGGQSYYFDVVLDSQGLVSIRNIRGPRGLIQDALTSVPQFVIDDMTVAKGVVVQTQSETAVSSGDITFTGETYQDVPIAPGILNNTNYRVVFSTTDGILVVMENPTITGFRATVASAYGSVPSPKIVSYVVLVATQQASTTSGTVIITDADSSQKAVTFAAAFQTANYRVLLSPSGFFEARVINPTKTGFTILVGYTLQTGETITVGYDVFA